MAKTEVTRMCAACREVKRKSELLRVVKNANGIAVDPAGKSDGRGAYVCAKLDCVMLARKKRAFSRAMRCEVPDSLYDTLEQMVRNGK